ncbi:uncharacterized protein LOC126989868 [Eriocheir sinensis]|uniref:uncharacterized protein LOC126981183 n=1 Tax=Eriocheir sinensis TaxID=95602 RepID=UPI0021C79D0D|nr:uncharacterized protein LOC126981183 [Eriocheir sinensis]XP_050704450.1 uncharacterized protein LOC126989868 [Eriocheir sinensis]
MMREQHGGKFDAEEYLRLLQEAGTEKKRGGCPQNPIRSRFCSFSSDPVQNDCIWRAVVRGENAASYRRKIDYGSLHRFYQETSWLGSSNASLSLTSAGSQREGDGDSFEKRLHINYGHVTQGPPPPTTSSAVIGWRSSLPELRLERYGNRPRRCPKIDSSNTAGSCSVSLTT